MKLNTRALVSYIILLVIVMLAVYFSDSLFGAGKESYTFTQFYNEAQTGKVRRVEITPYEDVPTGSINLLLDTGKYGQFYCSDVREIENIARELNIPYIMYKVSKPNWFLTSVLPYIVVLVIFVVMFSMMTGGAGGGANAKVMNFGRSRAKLASDMSKKFNFSSVAD